MSRHKVPTSKRRVLRYPFRREVDIQLERLIQSDSNLWIEHSSRSHLRHGCPMIHIVPHGELPNVSLLIA